QEVPIDVRVVAATNRELIGEVAGGRFREDLFYRLNVVAIRTVPLGQRAEDIPSLAAAQLRALSARYGVPHYALSDAALDVLRAYAWPGNVRELENVLERAVLFTSGDEIEPDTLADVMAVETHGAINAATPGSTAMPDDGPAPGAAAETPLARAARAGIVSTTPLPGVFRVEPTVQRADTPQLPPGGVAAAESEWPTLADIERTHLVRTLAATMNNKSQAAKLLGIDRSVLRRKLQRHGLDEPVAPGE
ncbi:MAG: helix-turn-helix domain-containing protein, partial [Planctomycetia bacterium]